MPPSSPQEGVAARRAAAIDAALRDFARSGKGRRNKYEIALDALVRVEDAFDSDHGDEYERVLAVLRDKADQ